VWEGVVGGRNRATPHQLHPHLCPRVRPPLPGWPTRRPASLHPAARRAQVHTATSLVASRHRPPQRLAPALRRDRRTVLRRGAALERVACALVIAALPIGQLPVRRARVQRRSALDRHAARGSIEQRRELLKDDAVTVIRAARRYVDRAPGRRRLFRALQVRQHHTVKEVLRCRPAVVILAIACGL
jgi:hypothetical protein